MTEIKSRISEILREHEAALLADWLTEQNQAVTLRPDLLSASDLREQSARFLQLLREGLSQGNLANIQRPNWEPLRVLLTEISAARARLGFTPTETATFVFSIKQPLFRRLNAIYEGDPAGLSHDYWNATVLLDQLGLFTTEQFQRAREEVIGRQQREMFELSSPVVELWAGILGLPIIGTLDSKRTQLVMESLLNRVAQSGAEVAILDITGVPEVDTLTAQNLLKTVAATRLMGAQCIISGVRPEIAQTMVHLGVNLGDIVTKSTMAAALAHAFRLRHLRVADGT